MALRKKRGGEQAIEIPMSSMIDVVFLLLIYFIVTAKEEIPEAHLAVNLPNASGSETSEVKPKLLQIEVHPTEYFLQGIPRPLENIAEALAVLAKLDPDQSVMIKVSKRAYTEKVVSVLDICNGVGLTQLNILTFE